MKISFKKVLLASPLAMLLIVIGIFAGHTTHAANVSAKLITVSASDVSSAGYSNVSAETPVGVSYQSPNLYFWVNGASANHPTENGVFNLLMVSQYSNGTPYTADLFSYGTTSEPVTISGGRGQEAMLSGGRVALNFEKGNYYIVIIGPDASNVEQLANTIAGKI